MKSKKNCKLCRKCFEIKERHDLYCQECKSLLVCVSCGKELNIHPNRLHKKRRSCSNCYQKTLDYRHQERGYVRVWTGKVYESEHHLVMAREINRQIDQNEVVHHLNGDKSDNRLENLKLMTLTEHKSMHCKKRWENYRKGIGSRPGQRQLN